MLLTENRYIDPWNAIKMQTNLLYRTKQAIHSRWSKFDYHRNLKNPAFLAQREALRSLKDTHQGERCFIIGNGPSLNNTDLSRVRGEFTFGLNRIYLLFDSLGFSTSYYVCANRLVLTQFKAEIAQKVAVKKFTVWEHLDLVSDISDIHLVYRHNGEGFYKDISKGIWGGATVTYMAMQIAYHLGFHEVILIGVDHSFSTKGAPHKILTSSSDDLNHFSPNYFGKGVRWQLPDLKTSEYAYSLARKHFEQAGRTIKDATVGGKLQVFQKIDYDSLWK